MKLRGTERQLLADACPLEHVAQLGQEATEVQFVLHRTGPTLGNGHKSVRAASKRRLPPSGPDPEPFDHRGARQASSTLPRRTKAGRVRSSSATASPEQRASPLLLLDAPSSLTAVPSYVSKEEVFRQILQQQKTLLDLEMEVLALEKETEELERSATPLGPILDLREELEELERRQLHNKEELILGEQWEELLQAEMDKEEGTKRCHPGDAASLRGSL